MSRDTTILRHRRSAETIDVHEDKPRQKEEEAEAGGEMKEEAEEEENETVMEAVANVAKNGLGIGIYFIAGLMTKSGTKYVGEVLSTCALISALGFYYIGKACDVSRTKTYEGLFSAAFGEQFSWICSCIIAGFTFTVVLLYTLLLGFFTHYTFKELGMFNNEWLHEKERVQNALCIVVVLFTCGFPISFFKKISFYKYTSAIGLLGVIFSGVLHFYTDWSDNNVPGLDWKDYPEAGNVLHYLTPIAIVSASFNCHFNAANYYNSVGKDLKKFEQVTMYSFGIMLFTCGIVAYFSYKNFGATDLMIKDGAPSIFGFCNDDFKKSNPGLWVGGMGACLLVALNIAFGIGLVLFPLRFSVNELWNKLKHKSTKTGKEMSDTEHTCITNGLLFIVLLTALGIIACSDNKEACVGAVAGVLDWIVCLFACHVAFTLPGIMYLKVEEKPTATDQFICYVLIVTGCIACVTGLIKIYYP